MASRDTPTLSNRKSALDQRHRHHREQEYRQALARLDKYSRMTDSQFRIPLTRIRFGVDPILGLIPVIGDFIGLLLSIPVLMEASRVGAPAELRRRMIRNMVIEAVIGVIPILGDAFDVYWKANTRNTAWLRQWINTQLVPEKVVKPKERLVIISLAILLLALLLWWLL
jgi:branched-subunit amino acid ABC-type transport system permease component